MLSEQQLSANSCLDFVSAIQLIKYFKGSRLSETATRHLYIQELMICRRLLAF